MQAILRPAFIKENKKYNTLTDKNSLAYSDKI